MLIACLITAAGCTATGPLFSNSPRNPRAVQAPEVVDTGGLSVYLATIDQLLDGDTLTQAAAFSDAENDAAFAPTTGNRLRYALALAVPDHPGSDPAAAVTRLRDLLAAGDALHPAERMLATMQLHNAEKLMVLEQSRAELQRRYDAAVAARDADAATEIRRLQSDNARLQNELRDATEMLDAITSIEESISEREDDAN